MIVKIIKIFTKKVFSIGVDIASQPSAIPFQWECINTLWGICGRSGTLAFHPAKLLLLWGREAVSTVEKSLMEPDRSTPASGDMPGWWRKNGTSQLGALFASSGGVVTEA